MIKMIKELFKRGPETDFAQLKKNGAVIIDVRSRAEFETGHIKGAINIPVDVLRAHLSRIPDKKKTVITCCASGMRSSSAASILREEGYEEVFNGGGWSSLQQKI